MKLHVPFLLASTLLASAAVRGGGVETMQSVTHSIGVETLTIGQTIKVAYLSPDKGRVTVDLISAGNDRVLHVDARFDWPGWYKTLILNSAVGSDWQHEEQPSGFPFPSVPNTPLVLHISVKEGFFEIAAKGFLYEYQYRGDLLPATVEMIEYNFHDMGAEKKAKLLSMAVSFSTASMALAAAAIVISPQNSTSLEGNMLILTCVAFGASSPEVLWLKDGAELMNNTTNSIHFNVVEAGGVVFVQTTLEILSLELGDAGLYSCMATNNHSTNTESFQVDVEQRDTADIVIIPQKSTSIEGNMLILTCVAFGLPSSVVLWLKDGAELMNNTRTSIHFNSVESAGVLHVYATLEICSLELGDAGLYSCMVTNNHSTDTESFQVTVNPRASSGASQTDNTVALVGGVVAVVVIVAVAVVVVVVVVALLRKRRSTDTYTTDEPGALASTKEDHELTNMGSALTTNDAYGMAGQVRRQVNSSLYVDVTTPTSQPDGDTIYEFVH